MRLHRQTQLLNDIQIDLGVALVTLPLFQTVYGNLHPLLPEMAGDYEAITTIVTSASENCHPSPA